jgi:hypothetical protein
MAARYQQRELEPKEGCVNTYFRHHRQRGPVNALQQKLQG